MSVAMPAAEPVGNLAPSVNQRLRDTSIEDADRHFGVAMHLSPLAGLFFAPAYFAPLVLWLVRRESSSFDDDHGREVINFCVSVLLWHIVTAITLIGFALWPVIWIVAIVNLIRGACAAGAGEYFRYPMTVRFI